MQHFPPQQRALGRGHSSASHLNDQTKQNKSQKGSRQTQIPTIAARMTTAQHVTRAACAGDIMLYSALDGLNEVAKLRRCLSLTMDRLGNISRHGTGSAKPLRAKPTSDTLLIATWDKSLVQASRVLSSPRKAFQALSRYAESDALPLRSSMSDNTNTLNPAKHLLTNTLLRYYLLRTSHPSHQAEQLHSPNESAQSCWLFIVHVCYVCKPL